MSSTAYNDAIKKMSSGDIEYVEIADMDHRLYRLRSLYNLCMDTDNDDDVDDVKEEDRTIDFRISRLREHINRVIYSVLSLVRPLISLVFAGRTFGWVTRCS